MSRNNPRYQPTPPNVWRYTLPGDWTVLAGKSDVDNDWWFHVRGMAGSHVILKSKPGRDPDRDTRKAAAAIAAYHSKAGKGGVTAVSCTRARFVTKARGKKPGTVTIRKETVLKVRPALPGK